MSPTDTMPAERSTFPRLLREPFFHFTLIGATIFAVALWRGDDAEQAGENQIVLTNSDLDQLVIGWQAQGLPAPNAEQIQRLLDSKIREEILYREALIMGLDQDDTIVKRRMAQKMNFLAEDLTTLQDPTEADLQAWFDSHQQDFAFPPRVDFRHLYFSSDRHRDKTREAAASTLVTAQGLAADSSEAAALGEPFMFKDSYASRTPEQLAKEFGGKFAKAIFELTPGTWTGPIESGYGWHLIFIESITPSRIPAFDEVKSEVRTQWETQQRAEFKEEAFRVMREKYQVILPDDLSETAPQ